ncbi:MAG: PAAR domain-containing protein [Limnobacter sp.]|uniref:PAAR domain-containing protein n=1 Tax=Limnobacter sp. TaxID=2003368 RepID=UPI0032EEF242
MAARMLIDGRAQVVVGDTTSHGGKVISGSPTTFFGPGNIPIARVGDMTTCPICKPHVFPIVEGHPFMTDNHMQVALHGHKTACGATLIASATPAPPAPPADYNAITDPTLNSKPPTPWEVEFVDADGEPPKAGEAVKFKFNQETLEQTLDGEGKAKFDKAPQGFARGEQTDRTSKE